jgi:hypothetical protein
MAGCIGLIFDDGIKPSLDLGSSRRREAPRRRAAALSSQENCSANIPPGAYRQHRDVSFTFGPLSATGSLTICRTSPRRRLGASSLFLAEFNRLSPLALSTSNCLPIYRASSLKCMYQQQCES